jgi:phenylalanyl-tRNA synthetase beta chain
MGGDHTAVSDDTKNVYVEAAFWWPEAVMGRGRRYNFSTDAGHRFERGVDPAQTVEHIERITQLIVDICGTPQTQIGTMDDQSPNVPVRKPVALRVARAAKVIGMPITQADCERVFNRLGLPFAAADGVITVTPPSWRFDLLIEEDLIEEVIRVLGYPSLPSTPPLAPVVAKTRSESRLATHALRRAVAARDYFETINFSFVEERWERDLAGVADPIKLLNPIAAPLAVMRTSLIGSLVQVLRHNQARRAPRVRVFELGRVFKRDAGVPAGELNVAGIEQPLRLGGLAWGPADQSQWSQRDRAVDFFDVKGDLEALFAPRALAFVAAEHPALHPGRSARVQLGGRDIGVIGELHPRWRQAYEISGGAPVVFELELDAMLGRDLPQGQALPRQQSVQRDIALVVGEQVTHDALMTAIQQAGGTLLRSARLFDVFKPAAGSSADLQAHERSLAVRLELLDDEQPLTDERTDACVAAVIAAATAQLGARLRA